MVDLASSRKCVCQRMWFRSCCCLPSGANARTGTWFICFVVFKIRIHILGTAHSYLENMKQLVVRKI